MTPIEVRAQTRLSPARIFNLCQKGIRHRLFRSLLTTTVIVLAVAFFMVLLADSVIARAVATGVQAEVRQARRPAIVLDHWFGSPSARVLAARLADPAAPLADYAAIAGWTQDRLASLAADCRKEAGLTAWLEDLDAGARSILVGVERSDEGLARMAEEEGWRQFSAEAGRMPSLRLPMPMADIHATAVASTRTAASCADLASSWHTSIERVAEGMRTAGAGADPAAWAGWVAEADATRLAGFSQLLAANGFGGLYPQAEIAGLQADLRRESRRDDIVRLLKSDDGRAAWLKHVGSQAGVDDKLVLIDDPRADVVFGTAILPADRVAVAAAIRHERDLAAKEANLVGKVSGDGALVSVRQGFLIIISLLVCMVGIANAMLMAITERFREIATMKCLGATDGFILTQFLMEAGIQGAAGGAAGTVIGLLFSLLKGGWLYGLHLVWYFPALGLLAAMLGCVMVGLLLATLASIYPSWIASRMAPMEAMRVE